MQRTIAMLIHQGPLAPRVVMAPVDQVEAAEANGWGHRVKGGGKLPVPDLFAENADAHKWAEGFYLNREMKTGQASLSYSKATLSVNPPAAAKAKPGRKPKNTTL